MSEPFNCLFLAIEQGDIDGVSKAIENGVDVNQSDSRKLIAEGATPLHEVAHRGQVEIVSVLLESGANVNARDFGGWTPLLRACNASKTEVAAVLINAGAITGLKNNEGYTAASRIPKNNLALISLLEGVDSK